MGARFVYLTRTVALIVALPSRARSHPATWLSQIPFPHEKIFIYLKMNEFVYERGIGSELVADAKHYTEYEIVAKRWV